MLLRKCLRVGYRPVPIVIVEYWKISHWNAKKLLKKLPKTDPESRHLSLILDICM